MPILKAGVVINVPMSWHNGVPQDRFVTIKVVPYISNYLDQVDYSDVGYEYDPRAREQGVKAAEVLECRETDVMVLDSNDPLWMRVLEDESENVFEQLFVSEADDDGFRYVLKDGPTLDGVKFLIMDGTDGGDPEIVYARQN